MLRPGQPDLFGPAPAPSYLPDPDKIRSKLLGVMAKARAAPEVPWSPKDESLRRNLRGSKRSDLALRTNAAP